ncbi:hypothetical protein ACFLZ0_02470 [Patescibacteria group bacterium]
MKDIEENNKEDKFNLTSKKKWFWVGLIITLINPIFSGLVIGSAFLSEPELKKQGKIIIALAIIWGVVALFFTRWLFSKGYFNGKII